MSLRLSLVKVWVFVLIGCAGSVASGAGLVRWHPESATLDASLERELLSKVLSDVGALTGWDVMVEPGLKRRVSTRFEGLTINQGLRRILGDLNFAVLQGDGTTKKLFIYQQSIGAATEALRTGSNEIHPKSRRIENELIVTLDPNSPETIEEIAKRLGAEVVGKIDGMNAYRLRFKDAEETERARKSLASADYVEVTDNFEVDIPARLASLNFGNSARPRVRVNPDPNAEQVVVGLIDTPVQPEGISASEFLLPTVSVGPGESSLSLDEPTHGTTMAETLLRGLEMVDDGGQGSNVRILPVDVYGAEEMTSTFQVAAGVMAAIDSGASIINLSLGGADTTPFLQNLISDAHQQGVVFIGAAGNEPGTHDVFPAAYPEVVAVTSANRFGDVAPYANNGDFVDVMVPGHSYVTYNGETYLINGTSASAAYVSGITAGVAAASGLPLNQVEAQIRQTLPKPPSN